MDFQFFLGADPDLDIKRLMHELSSEHGISEAMLNQCSMLCADREDCQAGIDEGIACGQANQQIYLLRCHSDIMSQDDAEEALCFAFFEGGSLNPDLHISGIA